MFFLAAPLPWKGRSAPMARLQRPLGRCPGQVTHRTLASACSDAGRGRELAPGAHLCRSDGPGASLAYLEDSEGACSLSYTQPRKLQSPNHNAMQGPRTVACSHRDHAHQQLRCLTLSCATVRPAGIRLAGATSDVHIMDVRSGKWERANTQGEPPSPRAAHAAAAVGSMVVVQVLP